MCCVCKLWIKGWLIAINVGYLILGIIFLVLFGFFKWGLALFLNFLTNELQQVANASSANTIISNAQVATALQPYIDPAAFICLVVGLSFSILAIVGILGAVLVWRIFVIGYILLLGAALAAFAAGVIYWFVSTPQREISIKQGLISDIQTYYVDVWQLKNNFNIYALAFNWANANFECCGINDTNPQFDYQLSTLWNRTIAYNSTYSLMNVIPSTCCVLIPNTYQPLNTSCTAYPTVNNSYLNSSCYEKLYSSWIAPYTWVQWVIIAIVAIIIFGPAILMVILCILV